MNESLRTVIYLGVAGVISLLAWASQPSAAPTNVRSLVNQPLFPEFKEATDARSLQIVKFDEGTAELRSFEVAQRGGLWVIPSHGDYPADAEQQIQGAAGSLIGLEIVDIASQSAGDHALFGVIEPDKTKLKVGDKDVGTLVALQDGEQKDLVRLIVGKEVDGSPGQRFVRKPDQDVVYITKIGLDKLPTEFDKWIEKDLLKINTFDVARLTLKDYSILPTQTGGFAFAGRMEAAAVWNADQSNWNLESLKMFSQGSGTPIDQGLAETEELNRQKLDDLKTALDDLKIVDVVRKPAGLRTSLREGSDITQNQDLITALLAFGFLPSPDPRTGKPEIFATNGEVVVDMKDGVQYVLRFGNVQGAEAASETKEGEDDEVKLNRYLFVTAQLSPHTLVEPTYEPEPAGPEPAAPATDADAAADKPADAAADEKSDETKDAAAQPADPKAAERDRIKRENERKRNEYNDKKKKAEARVSELNGRFADWYYVISEDVYKKIHLSRGDLVKEGAKASEEGFGVDAFRKLETDGLKSTAPPPPLP